MPETEQRSQSVTHRNNGLVADYYPNEIVPTLPEWDDATLVSQATVAYNDLRQIREHIQPELLDEAQLEEQWVKPVLDALNMS